MDFITVPDAAEQAGVTKRYIQAEIERGNIKARKLDPDKPRSDYLIDPKSFSDWMKRRRAREQAKA